MALIQTLHSTSYGRLIKHSTVTLKRLRFSEQTSAEICLVQCVNRDWSRYERFKGKFSSEMTAKRLFEGKEDRNCNKMARWLLLLVATLVLFIGFDGWKTCIETNNHNLSKFVDNFSNFIYIYFLRKCWMQKWQRTILSRLLSRRSVFWSLKSYIQVMERDETQFLAFLCVFFPQQR